MNTQTLVVGSIVFDDVFFEEDKLKVLEELAGVLEFDLSDIRYDIRSGKWEFQNVNWSSNIEKESIENFLEQYKGYFKSFTCSLHYLTDPDTVNYRDVPALKSGKKEE